MADFIDSATNPLSSALDQFKDKELNDVSATSLGAFPTTPDYRNTLFSAQSLELRHTMIEMSGISYGYVGDFRPCENDLCFANKMSSEQHNISGISGTTS